jgi:antitoxin component YwqK of YwqJK toxin-antitoxin module
MKEFKRYYENGNLHRTDGPAVENENGYKAWYLNGKHLTETEFNEWFKINTLEVQKQKDLERLGELVSNDAPQSEIDSLKQEIIDKYHPKPDPFLEPLTKFLIWWESNGTLESSINKFHELFDHLLPQTPTDSNPGNKDSEIDALSMNS